MLAPFTITRRFVVYPCEKRELLQRNLLRLDAKLLVQLPLCCSLHALYRCLQAIACLARDTEWVRTAGVCPHICTLSG